MKIERTKVFGFEAAIHGMRNPMNSWDMSDSKFIRDVVIGPDDNELAKRLIKAGPEHCKFLRLIHIQCFITIPRYIWQELDTYKVSTVRMSCSTMHKLGSKPLDASDFQDGVVLLKVLEHINDLGENYRADKKVDTLRIMKQLLPEGFLQAADYDMSYQTAMLIYKQRHDHRMSEWSGKDGICEWIKSLPMMSEWLFL